MFDHTTHVAAGLADGFLRMMSMLPGLPETGHVESPIGHVVKVEITRDDVAKWVSAAGDPWMSERRNFTPGWYLIQTNNYGFIHGYYYESASDAFVDFAALERLYDEWSAK